MKRLYVKIPRYMKIKLEEQFQPNMHFSNRRINLKKHLLITGMTCIFSSREVDYEFDYNELCFLLKTIEFMGRGTSKKLAL